MIAMIDRNIDLAILLMGRMSLARDVERGDVQLEIEPIDLVRLVRETVSDLRYAVLSEHPTAVAGVDELQIEADPTVLREIVFNVLSNAAKYSQPDAPIEVTVESLPDSARVVVRNHGGGVTPGDTERLFEKFFQSDAAGSAVTGVGFGLFISRGLARAHGGDLTTRPAADEGSEFVLDLPSGHAN
jgi:signal transduction histidine kinase